MEQVRVRVPVAPTTTAGSAYTVHADDFDGSVDYSKSISRKLPLVTPREKDELWLEGEWLEGSWLSGINDTGWLTGGWLEGDWLSFEREAVYVGSEQYGPSGANGYRTFSAKVYDEMGVSSGSTPPETTIGFNTSPRPPRNLSATGLTAGTVSFTFTPSPDLAA